MTRPNTSVMGKPTANRFSCGAARLMMPNATFTMSKAVTPGRATASAPENNCPPQLTIDHMPSGPSPVVPIGRVRKPSTRV